MRRFRSWRAALAVVTVAATAALPVPEVRAAEEPIPVMANADHVVHVGGGDVRRDQLETDIEAQFTAFYPQRLQVHRGDLVEWRFPASFGSWHTVTFRAHDMDVALHPESHEHAHGTVTRADEVPELLAFNEDFILSPSPTCGRIHRDPSNNRDPQPPCVVDSTDRSYGSEVSDAFYNLTELQPQAFAAHVDLPEGNYRYHCNVHPQMHGEVEVVPDTAPVKSMKQVEAETLAELQADLEVAEQLHAQRSSSPPEVVNGQVVHSVHVGAMAENGRVALLDFLPNHVDVEPGDAVKFVTDGNEPHTVTFPGDLVGGYEGECHADRCGGDGFSGIFLAAFGWGCEYDDPTGGVPAVPFSWVPSQGCQPGSTVEAAVGENPAPPRIEWNYGDLMARPTRAHGDEVRTDGTFHNSAYMVAAHMPEWYRAKPNSSGPRWASEFTARFPSSEGADRGTFEYECMLHPDAMSGTVRVRDAS